MQNATISVGVFSRSLSFARWIPEVPEVIDEGQGRQEPPSALIFGTTIDPRLMYKKPDVIIDEGSCIKSKNKSTLSGLTAYTLNREQTFACIAMFENGKVNLDPGSLQQVMALATGNSIYVAMSLVCDPIQRPLEYEMKHIIGNIGRHGISLMIPPANPKIRKVDENVWRHVVHAGFDGRFEDCFQHTSMHLSFTRYKLPISVESHGDQAIEAHFVETLVSVFDHEEWLADLDILQGLRDGSLTRVSEHSKCRHKAPKQPAFSLTSVDSWDAYFDHPTGPAIFRANKNLYGRLAATIVNSQRGFKTILFRDESSVCWPCIAKLYKDSVDVTLSAHGSDKQIPMFIC
ncbi:hypothetical protein PVAG01_11016 [Phlyctema vagabunda]|uniref:Uncharacterized protein n=1 Tax=Phlyctema vagabunda TaxID=108571 RepID=A0ABR4P3W5_9HELO